MKNDIFSSKHNTNFLIKRIYTLGQILILGVLLSSIIFSWCQEETTDTFIYEPAISVSHSPISIDGNAALDAFCSGKGTDGLSWATAHLIESYEIYAEIDASGVGSAIEIKNTDRYLIIRDCILHNSVGEWSAGGVFLQQCQYINITGCKFLNNAVGINIWKSYNIAILANNGSYCGSGVRLSNSNNNIISNNFISYGSTNGIHLNIANHNTISSNEASHNANYGIKLEESNNNIISDNNASYNHYSGIYLDKDTENNQIYQNIVCSNDLSNVNDLGSNNDVRDNDECAPVIPSFPLLWILGFISLGFVILFQKTHKILLRYVS